MADIAMCSVERCPSKALCKRSPASGTPVSDWQWWQAFDPADEDRCGDFWPNREEEHDRAA
jgi:hypothetical protein